MKDFLATAKGKIIVVSAAVVIIAAVVSIILISGSETGYRNISISEVFGKVMTENDGKEYEAYKNMHLAGGYALTTDSDSYSRMVLDDDKYMKLEQLSRVLFENLGSDQKRRTVLRLESGALTTEIASPLGEDEDFIVNTPNAVLAVRGTFFRVEVRYDEDGIAYTDVYTYGGKVVCKRVRPDGAAVDEEVTISAGYKARIKMDDIVTVYVEELAEESGDNVDPIEVDDIPDGDLVDIYNASLNGHEMFLTTLELWLEIKERGIDLDQYHSVYDGGEIPPYGGETNDTDRNDTNGSGSGGDEGENDPSGVPEETDPDSNDAPDGSDNQENDQESEKEHDNSDENGTDNRRPANGSGGDTAAVGSGTSSENADNGESEDQGSDDAESGDVSGTDDGENDSGDSSDESEGTDSEEGPGIFPGGIVPGIGTGGSSGSNSGSSDTDDDDSSEEEEEESDVVLYTDDGSIIITSTGYSQDGGAETPYTGNYTIAQQSSGAVNASITVASGAHTVTLKGVNITEADGVLTVSAGAGVTLKGSGTSTVTSTDGIALYNEGTITISSGAVNFYDNSDGNADMPLAVYNEGTLTIGGTASVTVESPDGYYGIGSMGLLKVTGNASLSASAMAYGIMDMGGSIEISGGTVNVSSQSIGIYEMGSFEISGGRLNVQSLGIGLMIDGEFTMTGGSVEASGNGGDIIGDYIVVTGGSLRAVNGMIGAYIVNAQGYELECKEYTSVPNLTFENPDRSAYTYRLTSSDKASDGKYYVWQPVSYLDYNSDTIYLDNGDVTLINDALFTQDGVGYRWTVPHSPVIITQTAATVSNIVTVEGGTHDITFRNVNIRLTGESYVYPFSVEHDASVTLTSAGTASLYSSDDSAVYVAGTLTISSGTFNIESDGDSAVSNRGRLVINGGTITASGGGSGISTYSDMEINGGDITANGGMDITGSGALVSGGLYSTGSFKMTNGTFRAYDYSDVEVRNSPAGFHNNQGTFEMLGGTIIAESTNTANPSITDPSASNKEAYGFNNNGTFIMSGGDITATSQNTGYGGNSSTMFKMSGGTFTISGVAYGMLAGGTFDLSGGKITAAASNGYGLSYSGSDFKMTGGSFEVSGTSYDIYGDYGGGTLVIMGGSLNAANIYTNVSIVNEAGTALQRYTISSASYSGNITAAGYTYYLDEDDKASDGNYYVWLPGGLTISLSMNNRVAVMSSENIPQLK